MVRNNSVGMVAGKVDIVVGHAVTIADCRQGPLSKTCCLICAASVGDGGGDVVRMSEVVEGAWNHGGI